MKKKTELPPEWKDMVAIACFPSQVVEQPNWTSDDPKKYPLKVNFLVTPLEKEVRAFQTCFARDPDLTLEILTLARKFLARYDKKNCVTQGGRVRAFLVKYGNSTIIRDSGKLRLPKKNEFARWTMAELLHRKRKGLRIEIVPVEPLEDGQIAELLTDHYGEIITTDSVTQARRSVSVAYTKKGKPYYFSQGLLKRKI